MGAYDDAELARKDAARKKKATKSSGSWKNDYTFVNLSLTSDDKDHIREMNPTSDDVLEFLALKMDFGYKNTQTYSFDQGTYTVSLIGVDETCPNRFKIVTGKAGSLMKAFAVLMYKVDEMLQDDWSLQVMSDKDLLE